MSGWIVAEQLERIGGPTTASGGGLPFAALSIEEREATVKNLLAGHPDALLSGYTEEGYLTALPEGLSWPDHQVLLVPGTRSTMLDLVVPENRLAIVESWERIGHQGIAVAAVRALADPGRVLTLTMIDLRERYGVGIAVLTSGKDPSVPRTADITSPLLVPARARQATMRKSRLAVITAADANVTRMLGWAPHELIGLRSSELVHPDDRERAITQWIDLVSTNAVQRIRLRHACKDGGWLWVEIENVHNGAEGPDDVEIAAHLTDISDEMAAHEAVQRRERLLRRLAEALPTGVLQIRRDRSVVFANARLSAMLGTSNPKLADLLARATAESRAAAHAAVDAALGHGQDGELELELPGRETREGRRFAVSVVAVEADTDDGEGALICVSDVTASVRLREKLTLQATRDPLTGCLNRSALMETLTALLEDGGASITAIFIDIDNFKPVNDRHGHAAGDQVLVTLARRLQGLVREGDLVARLGGDEFLVLGRGLDEGARAAVLTRLQDALNTPVSAGVCTIELRASVGVSLARSGDTPEELLARADAAMYECKRRGSRLGPVVDVPPDAGPGEN